LKLVGADRFRDSATRATLGDRETPRDVTARGDFEIMIGRSRANRLATLSTIVSTCAL